MPTLVWMIVGVVFGLPVLIVLGLVIANRVSKGNPGKAINMLWLIMAAVLAGFLFFAVRSGLDG